MNPKTEVYLLRIQRGNKVKAWLREIGGEQSQTFESLEALLSYLDQLKAFGKPCEKEEGNDKTQAD